ADTRIAQRKVLPQECKFFVITVQALIDRETRIAGRQLVESARELLVGQRQDRTNLADADDSISPEQLEPSVARGEVQQVSRSLQTRELLDLEPELCQELAPLRDLVWKRSRVRERPGKVTAVLGVRRNYRRRVQPLELADDFYKLVESDRVPDQSEDPSQQFR